MTDMDYEDLERLIDSRIATALGNIWSKAGYTDGLYELGMYVESEIRNLRS